MTDPGAMLMDFQFHYICGIHLVTMTKIEVLHIKGKYSKRRKSKSEIQKKNVFNKQELCTF